MMGEASPATRVHAYQGCLAHSRMDFEAVSPEKEGMVWAVKEGTYVLFPSRPSLS